MYKTKFNRNWTKQFPCIIADDASQHHFRCTVCMSTISCAHQGLTDVYVSRHCESDTHKDLTKIKSSQPSISSWIPTAKIVNEKVKMA